MKTSGTILGITSISATCAFICSYFFNLTMNNAEQYLAVVGVMFLDGMFGMIAGSRKEGFQTRKAIKVLKNTFAWIAILTVILMVEKGFSGTGWLSEVMVVPFMVFQLISALKNASMAGFIKMSQLNYILDQIDKHKGIRDKDEKTSE
jgi:phage-related holin